jgi:hypothetical protein
MTFDSGRKKDEGKLAIPQMSNERGEPESCPLCRSAALMEVLPNSSNDLVVPKLADMRSPYTSEQAS